jgi:hypothetical protein
MENAKIKGIPHAADLMNFIRRFAENEGASATFNREEIAVPLKETRQTFSSSVKAKSTELCQLVVNDSAVEPLTTVLL